MNSVRRLIWGSDYHAVQGYSSLEVALTRVSGDGVQRVRRHALGAALARALTLLPPLLLAAALPIEGAHASTFTVTTSASSGPGSLSDAIAAANATPGVNTIVFANGITSIDANVILPSITNPLTFNTSANLSIAALLSGSAPVTWSGGGIYSLTGSNLNFTAGAVIDGSLLQVGSGASSASVSGTPGTPGAGAAGGTAVIVNGGSFTNSSASQISGGDGGSGANGGYTGGNGGDGVSINSGSVINNGDIAGGNGGTGGGNAPPGTGYGGLGGNGVTMSSAGNLTNNGSISGGGSGAGRKGGSAVAMISGGSFVNNGSLTGGSAGAAIGLPPYGAQGGDGLDLVGGTVINNGSIIGADGSAGVFFHGPTGGAGGIGITASSTLINGTLVGATVINNGQITGGMGSDGTIRAPAIELLGGGNTLVIEAGSSITGQVVSCGSDITCHGLTNGGDTIALGGAASSSFDVSQIGSQYIAFSSYEKTGESVWVLTGTTANVTPWVINQGTLSISSDANLGGSAGGLTLAGGALQTTADVISNRSVTLGNNGGSFDTDGHTLTLDGQVSGAGSLIKVGAGTLILNNTNAYTGDTTVSGGTLEVGDSAHTSASISSAVTIKSTGILRGHGTVGGDVTSDGTVWPGASLGTLVIRGNYTQHADGSLQIDVTPTQASQLVVGGNANLSGTLNLVYAPGTYAASTAYTIIQAGSLTGRFNTVNATGAAPALLSSQLNYTGTQANLVLAKLSIDPTDGSLYGNLVRSANLVGQQTTSSVLDVAPLGSASCNEVQQARESNTPHQTCLGGAWVQATGSSLTLAGSNGLNTNNFGLLGGVDREVGDVHVGVEAGVNRVNANDPSGGYGDINVVHAGLYGFTGVGPLTLSANLDGAHDAYHVNRQTGIGNAVADPDGQSLSGALQVAWPLQLAEWRLSPRLGVLYQHQQMDGFAETVVSNNPSAPAFALNAERSTYTSLQPYFALSIARDFQFQDITYLPALSLGYRYNTRSTTPPTVHTTALDGTLFTLSGASQGSGLATVGARITAEAGASWNLYLDYQGLFANRLHDNALSLGFEKHF